MFTAQPQLDALPDTDDWGVDAARLLLESAQAAGCSDLHVLCQRDGASARVRRDGALLPLAQIPAKRVDLLLSRFKVLANLPSFVRHEPQDGRIEWENGSGGPRRIFRVSFLPTVHGQNLVVRFPEMPGGFLALDSLGMPDAVREEIVRLLMRREGVILLTGPSSSGKTTTMYAMLHELHRRHGDRLNFLTIEDPVERDLAFASQMQINEPQGLTFERALRSAVRHDPDVLLIGEIRDSETARIAVQAGLSGHLVVSTLHAGRASLVFTRLLTMGVPPYLAASALSAAVAQRLARVLCPACRRRGPGEGDWIAEGCEACGGTGCAGRRGIFELVVATEDLRQTILNQASASQIAAEAARTQTCDLASEGQRLVEAGEISRAEYEFLLSGEDAR